jgi:hypothetical protein
MPNEYFRQCFPFADWRAPQFKFFSIPKAYMEVVMQLKITCTWGPSWKRKQFFNLPLYGSNLAPRQKKDTYQLGSPICNPWSQCWCNKTLLFWWNPHHWIKTSLTLNLFFLLFSILCFLFSFFKLSLMLAGEWWKEFIIFLLEIWKILEGYYMKKVSQM